MLSPHCPPSMVKVGAWEDRLLPILGVTEEGNEKKIAEVNVWYSSS